MNWYALAIQRYVDITGRSSRTEFWMFALINIVLAILALFLDNLLNINFVRGRISFGPIYILYALFALIPGITVAVRRLHDTSRSGLYLLIGLIPIVGSIWLLVLYCLPSDASSNKYGPNVEDLDLEQIQDAIKNNGKTHETEEHILVNSGVKSDIILLLVVGWIFLSSLFWTLIRRFSIDLFSQKWFPILNYLMRFIWLIIPFMIAASIKDKNKRILGFVFAALYACLEIIEEVINVIQ